ncbi:hypothetical protein O3M35_010011 [Rhynocoris fuscipes]|uniref:Uncharacterized protein n=1 Tax=Rhynocoris fuscipes TaxID=488301 RepID=A0AAW1CYB9_9HEMI
MSTKKYLYRIEGEHRLRKFVDNPLKYVYQDIFVIPPKNRTISTGSPFCMRNTLADSIAKKLAIPKVKILDVVHFISNKMAWSFASDCVEACNIAQEPISEYVQYLCVEMYLRLTTAFTTGWTLTEITLTGEALKFLRYFSLKPDIIYLMYPKDIYLYMDNILLRKEILLRNPFKHKYKLNYSPVLAYPSPRFLKKYQELISWSYEGVITLNDVYFKQIIIKIANRITADQYLNDYAYQCEFPKGKLVSLRFFNIVDQIKNYKKAFKLACPLCAIEWNQIVFARNKLELNRTMGQKLNQMAWFCTVHYSSMTKKDIQFYFDPDFKLTKPMYLQDVLPKKQAQTIAPELMGTCPVCLMNIIRINKGTTRIKFGTIEHAVFFENKVYYACSKMCAKLLRRNILQFVMLKTPLELKMIKRSEWDQSPDPSPEKLLKKYHDTFWKKVEKLNKILQDGLIQLDYIRPVFPGLTMEVSACQFLAYYLLAKGDTRADIKKKAENIYKKFLILLK